MTFFLLLLLGYACGSVPFGKLIGLLKGVDIQQRGSGNIGFANAVRVLGWPAGVATLLGDVLKGAVPTYLASQELSKTGVYTIGIAAILGHLFPVWLKFRGGKGIATGLGVLIVLQPAAALAGLGAYILCYFILRRSDMSSLFGTTTAAVAGSMVSPAAWWQFGTLIVIALWTHRKNLSGTLPNYDL